MERDKVEQATPDGGWKRDAGVLLLLVLLVLPLRLWLLSTTEVAARDSIGYIRYALRFEQMPWYDVLKHHDQHPGYSLAVLAVSQPLRWLSGQTDARTMQLAAQLTSVLAALLLLYPMYQLGRLLFNRWVAFGGTLLYQYFPISGHHLSDGISETLFLLMVAATLLQAVRAVNTQSLPRYGLCGFFGALAYLVRPEGGLVALATIVVLAIMQAMPHLRVPWRQAAKSSAALSIFSVAMAAILIYGFGTIPKDSVREFFKLIGVGREAQSEALFVPPSSSSGGPLFAAQFIKSPQLDQRALQSARAITVEISNGYHYAGLIPLLLGFACSIGRLRHMPGFWLLVIYSTLHAAALFALGMTKGYVSDRHVMTLVMCGSLFAAAGMYEGSRWLLAWPRSIMCYSVLLAGLIAICLPKTLQPLHANRAVNRAAGEWLATTVKEGDIVHDDHCWSHFYAEQLFTEGNDPVLPPDATPTCYVVITRSKDNDIALIRQHNEADLRAAGFRIIWPEVGNIDDARVVIYAGPRDPAKDPWRIGQ